MNRIFKALLLLVILTTLKFVLGLEDNSTVNYTIGLIIGAVLFAN